VQTNDITDTSTKTGDIADTIDGAPRPETPLTVPPQTIAHALDGDIGDA
jgi:hypothetical protein